MELAHLKKICLSTFLLLLTISCAVSTPTTRLLEGVYFTDPGGYEIQLVKDYIVNEFTGGIEMLKPGSTILVGPGFLVYGGLIEEERTNEELWKLITLEKYNNFQFDDPKARKIDSISGFIGEFQGVQASKNVRGKLFLSMIDENEFQKSPIPESSPVSEN